MAVRRNGASQRTRSGHIARKRFGQHFLIDKAVIAAIVDAISPRADDLIMEIGPGPGALTDALLARLPTLNAVEIDRDLAAALRVRYAEDRLRLFEADALRFDFAQFANGRALRLVGNLPYNISSPLLVALAHSSAPIVDQHFMLQKEVVERIVASAGNADYGRLGVLLQSCYECDSVLDVPAEAFDPPPRVQSAVVRMHRIPCRVRSLRALSAVLSVAFGQRRKMLRGRFVPWLHEQGLQAQGFEPTQRAEEVPVDVYFDLADQLAASRPD